MPHEQLAHAVGDRVDVVPPRAGDDELLVHGKRGERPEAAVAPLACELDRGVPLLAVLRFAPKGQDGVLRFRERRERVVREDGPAYAAESRHPYPEIRQVGFHVLLHPGRLAGIGRTRELRAQGRDQRVTAAPRASTRSRPTSGGSPSGRA